MELDDSICYRAVRARDARFDGRFFIAVRTTRIFCRPVCPAPTPRRENCLFVPSAAAAQELGYRPCLRCRPETSPGTPAWQGSSALVSRALRLIDEGALDSGSVDDLAARVGIGERQLRRLFVENLGAPPLAVAQTRRVLFAKHLLDATSLSMTEVAYSSGFASLRRFNAAMQQAYRCSPRELRRTRIPAASPGSPHLLRLGYRPPLDWAWLAGFLAVRAVPGIERVDDCGRYVRAFRAGAAEGLVRVGTIPGQNALLAEITLSGRVELIQLVVRLRRLFDLGAVPALIGEHLGRDPLLASAVRAAPGLRLPGAWDGFELAVRAVLGQQVSVAAARTMAGRLVQRFGAPLRALPAQAGEWWEFPRPEVLAAADVAAIGLPRSRAATIRSLAQAVADGRIHFDPTGDLDASVAALDALPGIGAWTANYIAMRALGEPDAFPAGDLGVRRALGNGNGPASERAALAAAEAWRPWRAYAVMHLWGKE